MCGYNKINTIMKLLLSIIYVLTLFPLFGGIKGKVNDPIGNPIEFASVALYSVTDTTLITGSVTDSMGYFEINSELIDNTFLKVSMIGYETKSVPTDNNINIVLNETTNELEEVVVFGDLPKIRIKDDALVTTIQNTVLSKAGTANDVLKRLPSLTGGDGEFEVFGKGKAKIFINNREMRDLTELDNINSNDIKEVEIITNPGARYDASVNAVIRIYTIRKTGDGLGFDLRSSYYRSQNTDLANQLNVNYRKNGWDIFGTVNYHHSEWFQDSNMRQTTNVDTIWTQENKFYDEAENNYINSIAGINYEISPKHYAGMKYTLTLIPSQSSLSRMNSIVLANGTFYDEWNSNEESISDNEPAHRFNIYYNGEIGKLKIDMNTDFYSNKQSSQSIVKEVSQEYEDRTVSSVNDVNNQLFASKLVFSYPVLKGQLLLGSEYTNTNRDDIYKNMENYVPSSNTTIHERNNSFFVEYSREIIIGQIGAGLRYENVRSEYFDNKELIDEQSRNYDQWFPNLSFSTKIKNVNLQLSYTAKTLRPTYRQLSNNVFYGNRLLIQTGNPFLKPSVIHDVTLTGTWKFIQLMTSYKNEKDAIIFWTEQMENYPAISILTFRNLENMPTLTSFLTLSPTIGIWSPQLSVGVIKQWVTIKSSGNEVKLNRPLTMGNFNNSFQLPNNFTFTIDTRYMGSGESENVRLTEKYFVVNAGITKSFYDDRLRLELKGNDIFYNQKNGVILFNKQMELYQFSKFDSRKIELTVRYKFNTANSKYKGKGAGDSEINRF